MKTTWTVTTQSGSAELDDVELFTQLMMRVIKNEGRDDQMHLVQTLTEHLENNNVMSQSPIASLMMMSFGLGYQYHVFLSSNEVEIETDDTDDNQDDSN